MKSMRSKLVYAVWIAVLINGTAFLNGTALQAVQPISSFGETTGQTRDAVLEEFTRSLQTTASWNTFLGGTGDDKSYSLAMDGNGNSVVAGHSATTWGNPVQAYNALSDGFVAKLDSAGNLLWNTFLGGNLDDEIQEVILDETGNIYVIGSSTATWGSPLQPHLGAKDDFIAKLDTAGNLLWNTFLGVVRNSNRAGLMVDSLGNIYVTTSNQLVAEGPNYGCVIKLDPSGAVIWNILLGEGGDVFSHGIALDQNENVYVTGVSYSSWGSPLSTYTDAIDAFAAKLDKSTGALIWNTFLGGSNGRDVGYGIAIDASNSVYIAGHSTASWGEPMRAYRGDQDGMVAKLSPSGNLIWNTFLGGVATDYSGYEIEVDENGNIFVSGGSNATWGIPVQSYAGDYDANIVKLDPSGSLVAMTFLGGSALDKSYGIALGGNDVVLVAGYSNATWGLPVGPYIGDNDAFVAQVSFEGVPQSLVVNKVNDTEDGACDNDCSLREAIAAASSASIISFDPTLSGQTIALASTLNIDKNLFIDGSALTPPVQVSGDSNGDNQGDVLVFSVTPNTSLEMNGVNIIHGHGDENGGGIWNAGNLTLTNCTLNANRAVYGGAIYNASNANLNISNCNFSNNQATSTGGGIANFGNLEITGTTFSGNLTGDAQGRGSALYSEGIAKVFASTFSNNSQGTGTVYHASTGDSLSLVLENSSFENNNTAIYNNSGRAALNNNTIYSNDGGLYVFSGLVDVNNTIVSHNFFNSAPTDCHKDTGGALGKDNFNFFSSDTNCSVEVSGYGVALNSLADNGGPTKTMALKPNSPAINAGHDATCPGTDQRGATRPIGTHCDIGAYEYGEELPPMVVSITRMDPAQTSSQRVEFKVRFSEVVSGVNADDFRFVTTGSIRGYAVKSISPAKDPADSYLVSVNTGRYNGTLRLVVVDNDTIKDAANTPLGGPGKGNGNFTSEQVYTVLKKYALNLKSIAAQDGWILESGEKTGNGGPTDIAHNSLYLGDNAQKKQYRSILSFTTKVLPDKAVITKITLKLRKQAIVGPGDPFKIFQGLVIDFKTGYFGSAARLQSSDFQASTNKSFGPYKPALTNGWYILDLTPANTTINRLNANGGVTQLRLRLKLDDNNNKAANYLKLYSSNASKAFCPQLILEYYVP